MATDDKQRKKGKNKDIVQPQQPPHPTPSKASKTGETTAKQRPSTTSEELEEYQKAPFREKPDAEEIVSHFLGRLEPTEFLAKRTIPVHISQEHPTSQDFAATISGVTELYTKCLLIDQGRFSDLIKYAETKDSRFIEEAHLTIGKITHNSPILIEIIVASPTIVLALKTAINAIIDIPAKLGKGKLVNEKEKLEIEKQKTLFLIEQANNIITNIRPEADQEAKEMFAQLLLSSLSQLVGKGLTEPLGKRQVERGLS